MVASWEGMVVALSQVRNSDHRRKRCLEGMVLVAVALKTWHARSHCGFAKVMQMAVA